MNNKLSAGLNKTKTWIVKNMATILFTVLSIVCIIISEKQLGDIGAQVVERFARNTCLVLALIIPCLAGLGMNFGIVVGAMAAQISIFFVVHYGGTGITGFLICALVSTPLAIIFGYLLGLIFNKTKGAEMIAGLIFGFFADGIYRLFTLYIMGSVFLKDSPLILPRGFGLRNTYQLKGNIGSALNSLNFYIVLRCIFVLLMVAAVVSIFTNLKTKAVPLYKNLVKLIGGAVGLGLTFVLPLVPALDDILGGKNLVLSEVLPIFAVLAIVYFLVKLIETKIKDKKAPILKYIVLIAAFAVVFGLTFIPIVEKTLKWVKVTAGSYAIIVLFCLFNNWIVNTKLGQNMRTVGQSRAVATSAGINVNRTRIIATCISTVLAAWGQLIYLQDIGTFNTVQQQSNVGLYAVAAILVGGASAKKATNKQAVLGVILFHTLFVAAPLAAEKIVGDPAIAEYIRMFILYGAIAVSLAMHAYNGGKKKAKKKAVEASVSEAE